MEGNINEAKRYIKEIKKNCVSIEKIAIWKTFSNNTFNAYIKIYYYMKLQ